MLLLLPITMLSNCCSLLYGFAICLTEGHDERGSAQAFISITVSIWRAESEQGGMPRLLVGAHGGGRAGCAAHQMPWVSATRGPCVTAAAPACLSACAPRTTPSLRVSSLMTKDHSSHRCPACMHNLPGTDKCCCMPVPRALIQHKQGNILKRHSGSCCTQELHVLIGGLGCPSRGPIMILSGKGGLRT